jgi:hypothetical protein
MSIAETICQMAQQMADFRPGFFDKKGPGRGDRDTLEYMRDLRAAVETATGNPHMAELAICGDNALRVDFYVESEGTIVEIALGLRNPNCEFERDVLKALMAKEAGHRVDHLLFICKPGGNRRVSQPSSQAMIAWTTRNHGISVVVRELRRTEPEMPNNRLQPRGGSGRS